MEVFAFRFRLFSSFRRPAHARTESTSLAPTAAVKRTTGTPSPGSCGGGPASTSAGRCNVSVLAVDGALHDAPSRTDAMHCNMPRLRSLRRVSFHFIAAIFFLVGRRAFPSERIWKFECFCWEWRCKRMSGFLTSACAVSVLFACLPAEARERFVPADVVLSELLLFRELQTIVSAVAFARGTRGMLVGTKDLPKLACWLRASQI